LKCAPERRPKIKISTARMAPVGSVLHRGASAPFPPARFDAMMPDPTTAAAGMPFPNPSARLRWASDGKPGTCGCTLHAADVLQPLLQTKPVERPQRQCRENSDAQMQHAVGFLEGKSALGRIALGFGWIRNPPMREAAY
jgi:hypothetical protein